MGIKYADLCTFDTRKLKSFCVSLEKYRIKTDYSVIVYRKIDVNDEYTCCRLLFKIEHEGIGQVK